MSHMSDICPLLSVESKFVSYLVLILNALLFVEFQVGK